jgi:hypothetical protein
MSSGGPAPFRVYPAEHVSDTSVAVEILAAGRCD